MTSGQLLTGRPYGRPVLKQPVAQCRMDEFFRGACAYRHYAYQNTRLLDLLGALENSAADLKTWSA